MQNIFMSNQKPEDYSDKNGTGKYPDAPAKCPYKDCGINLKMKKNGFYLRYVITERFFGRVRIRRYICAKCGRTVSMLPSFCVAGITYGVEFIITLLQQVVQTGSIRKAAEKWRDWREGISRRLISKYITRIRTNRGLIQYGMNQISPDNISLSRLSGDTDWTKGFLEGMRPSLSPEFNAKFHKQTGKSFLSLQNRIA